MIAYLLKIPTLMAAIRAEILPAVHGDTMNEQYLDSCPGLESLFNEVLRLTVTAPMARVVTEPIVIGGKLLQKGNKVMVTSIMLQQSHSTPQRF